MTTPVHILKSFDTRDIPGAVEWTDICHDKSPCWVVSYQNTRSTGRWTCVPRLRPWMVYKCDKGPRLSWPMSSHKSLDLALRAISEMEAI